MARKKKVEGAPSIIPDPQPKKGNTVNYVFGDSEGAGLRGKIVEAEVTHVHEGHDGRLLNVRVQTANGPRDIGPTPWREHEEGVFSGNTWHWPEEKEEEPKE